jgi:DNA-binding winged helix-turn-helix (wHTH) protein
MRVVFGDCELDSGRRILLRHGRPTPLSPKAFQLLELLVDRRPEAVAKSELLEHLWADVFVSDASLLNLVAEIRAALGDNPRAVRYIRTLPRFGYAFQAEARPPARDLPSDQPTGPRVVSGDRECLLAEGANLVGRDRDCAVRIDSPTPGPASSAARWTGGQGCHVADRSELGARLHPAEYEILNPAPLLIEGFSHD